MRRSVYEKQMSRVCDTYKTTITVFSETINVPNVRHDMSTDRSLILVTKTQNLVPILGIFCPKKVGEWSSSKTRVEFFFFAYFRCFHTV